MNQLSNQMLQSCNYLSVSLLRCCCIFHKKACGWHGVHKVWVVQSPGSMGISSAEEGATPLLQAVALWCYEIAHTPP